MLDFSAIGQKPVLVLGRAGMDLYADPPGTATEHAGRFAAALGGSAANIAVALIRMGCPAALLTCVSDDAIGRFVLNELDRYGIDRQHVRPVGGEARNSLAVVETRVEGHQSVIYRNGAADFECAPDDLDAVDLAAYSAMVVTGTTLAAEPSGSATFLALDRARNAGMVTIIDLDYRPYSWPSAAVAAETLGAAAGLCDVIIGNDVEFGVLAGDIARGLETARRLESRDDRIIVYKRGEHGAITLADGEERATGIYRTTAIKPTGAGDAFLGTFLAALARGFPLHDAVLRGSAAAAIVVSRFGCAPAMPTGDELDAFLSSHPGPDHPERTDHAHRPV